MVMVRTLYKNNRTSKRNSFSKIQLCRHAIWEKNVFWNPLYVETNCSSIFYFLFYQQYQTPKDFHRYPKFNREFCNCSSELLLCSSIRRFYRRPACMQRKQIEVKSTAASRVEIGQVWHDSVLMMESRPQVQTLSWSNEGSKTRESEILPRQQQYSRMYKDVRCSRNTLKYGFYKKCSTGHSCIFPKWLLTKSIL